MNARIATASSDVIDDLEHDTAIHHQPISRKYFASVTQPDLADREHQRDAATTREILVTHRAHVGRLLMTS